MTTIDTAETPDPPLTLRDLAALEVGVLKGVGPKRKTALSKVGVHTVLDLLRYYPRRWIDRTREEPIANLRVGDEAMVVGTVRRIDQRRIRGNRTIVTATVADASGSLSVSFFNQPWRARQLPEGTPVVLFGKVDNYRGSLQMSSPVVDRIGDQTGKIVPVYPQSEKGGVASGDVARLVAEALRRSAARQIADPLPDTIRRRFGFVDRHVALSTIHEPEAMSEVAEARRRLVFDELFSIQLELVRQQRERQATEVGVAHAPNGRLTGALVDRLGFSLTSAQERVIDEILADMVRPHPMHRLLQGDVGAGKTLVAVQAMLAAVEGGFQGALMAPTEVLAEQHHLGVRALLDGLEVDSDTSLFGARPLRVELLTNAVTGADRRRILDDTRSGEVDILVGTHALIQDAVTFGALGMVVIDEQHRFGVEQRAILRDKGPDDGEPDVLVMTATPIPRTAAMTVYGDLDVSVLDELPPGRTPIVTRRAQGPDEESAMWAEVREAVSEGRQAYVVCPLIDLSESLEVRSVLEMHDELTGGELAEQRVGLLHGRLASADKDAVMSAFRAGDLDVLVATTVIEVGVDVPNATVMVILDAARFGIAQLHQLRGRVGRGAHASSCWLAGEATTEDGDARLDALVASTDGFELAEVDLELRGEGTILGERQKGRSDLRLASLRTDREVVGQARAVATELLDEGGEAVGRLLDDAAVLLGAEETEYLRKN